MDHLGNDRNDEVIRLLGQLKESGPEYPARLFTARRAAVLAAFAALPIGGAIALSAFARLVKLVKAMGVIDKIILTTELVAVTGLTSYGAVAAYVHRNELRQLLFPSATAVGSPFPSLAAPSLVPEGEGTPSETAIPTPTETPLFTPTSIFAVTPSAPIRTQAVSTQAPSGGGGGGGGQPAPTHGLHLGQTKTPKP